MFELEPVAVTCTRVVSPVKTTISLSNALPSCPTFITNSWFTSSDLTFLVFFCSVFSFSVDSLLEVSSLLILLDILSFSEDILSSLVLPIVFRFGFLFSIISSF